MVSMSASTGRPPPLDLKPQVAVGDLLGGEPGDFVGFEDWECIVRIHMLSPIHLVDVNLSNAHAALVR
jgi:hypothetical protein